MWVRATQILGDNPIIPAVLASEMQRLGKVLLELDQRWSRTLSPDRGAWSLALAASAVNIDPSSTINSAANSAPRFFIIFFIMAFTLPDIEPVRYGCHVTSF